MDKERPRKPLLSGIDLTHVDSFCQATGLDRPTVESLVASGQLQAAVDRHGRPVGIVQDDLPTGEQLRSWGLTVKPDYDPESLRSYEGPDEDDASDGTEGSTWTMTWGTATSEEE